MQLERSMLHGPHVQRRLLRHAASGRWRYVQHGSRRNTVFAMHHRRLLHADGSVRARPELRIEHGVLPAVHDQRDEPVTVSSAVLYEQHVYGLDKLRRDKLRRAVFLRRAACRNKRHTRPTLHTLRRPHTPRVKTRGYT